MQESPINRVASLIEQSGRHRKVEISVKRRFYPDHNTGLLVPIDCAPQDAKIYRGYKFEVVNHDLHLAFAPSSRTLPFLRITEPKSGGVWGLWFMGAGDNITPQNPVVPKLIDRGDNFVLWQLDDSSSLKMEILGHLIRKLIILDKRPSWNSLKFRIIKGDAELVDSIAIGEPQRRILAYRRGANLGFDNPVFWFTEPSAWDSSDIRTPRHTKPQYTLTQIRSGVWEMEISFDPNWLDSATYPVYIDPTIILQPDETEGKDARIYASDGGYGYEELNWGYSVGTTTTRDQRYSGAIGTWNSQFSRTRLVIQFDLSSIPAGSTINSAILELYAYYVNKSIAIRAHRLLEDWNEGTHTGEGGANPGISDGEVCWKQAKYNQTPDWNGGNYDNSYYSEVITGSAGRYYDWDVTQHIQDSLSNNYGIILRKDDDATPSYDENGFGTSGNTDHPEYRPKLTIDYVGNNELPAFFGMIAGKKILGHFAKAN